MSTSQSEILEFMTGRLTTPRDTGLLCPITGSRLMCIGYEAHVMDGETFYEAESDPNVKFSTHPFNSGVYYTKDRYFVSENGKWTEYIRVKGLSTIVPIDTPQSEIDELIRVAEEKREKSSREYEGKLYAGEITNFFPLAIKVEAKTIAMDLVKVEPMAAPSGFIFLLDQITEKTKHYVLAEEND